MKNCAASLLLLMWLALLCGLAPSASAQTSAAAEDPKLAADDKAGCMRNLKIIYDAIQAYQIDHKTIPNWLSDLVPQYISDANVLICPACKRTGEIEISRLADPRMPCSYLYEFSPVPLGKSVAPGDPAKTQRDWKRRQMGLVGSVVPIVCCQHHAAVLNLSFDGRIYESFPSWENLLSNKVDVAELTAGRLFAPAATSDPAPDAAAPPVTYPLRDPLAKSSLIDLSAYYNASLTEAWHGVPKNNLASLPTGVQNFGGVDYDVRGIVQVSSKVQIVHRFPTRINGIKIQQKCARLRFLDAAAFGSATDEGSRVGSYILHFATNKMQLEIPIIYGRDVRNWHKSADEKPSADLTEAWTGTNEFDPHSTIRLFTTTWVNVAPDVPIETIDFVSAMGRVAPFLIAITAE
jgi:hypothetical protein